MSKQNKANQNPVTVSKTFHDHGVKAIKATISDYIQKGGIADLEDTLKQAKESASSHIMGLAQKVLKAGKGVKYFLEVCKDAEQAAKDEHGKPINEVCPPWRQYKSDIKRAWEEGLKPSDFTSAQGMKNALNDLRKENNSEGGNGEGGSNGNEATPLPKDTPDELREAWESITNAVRNTAGKPEDQKALLDILNDANASIEEVLGDIMGSAEPVKEEKEAANG